METINDVLTANRVLLTEKLSSASNFVQLPSFLSKDAKAYIVWPGRDGFVNAKLDTVQSQANRMEPIFASYPELVPSSVVVYPNDNGGLEIPLLLEQHRCASQMLRGSFAEALQAYKVGNQEPLAKRNPTSLLFGFDARTDWTMQQRVLSATVEVRNARRVPAGFSLSTHFDLEARAKITAAAGKKASELGGDQVVGFTAADNSATLDVAEAPHYRPARSAL